MLQNRRTSPRFDIITVLEFKLGSKKYDTYFGITRNFSCEGFSLETQCTDFELGDSLEVRLKHPHHDLIVAVPGHVVWKRNAGKFATVMGIRLEETDLENRLRMLETMSAAGDIPVDSFFIDNIDADKEMLHKETPVKNLSPVPKDMPTPEISPEAHEDITPEEPEEEEIVHVYNDSIPLYKKFLSKKLLVYASITAAVAVLLTAAFFLIFENSKDDIKVPVAVPLKEAPIQEEVINKPEPLISTVQNEEETLQELPVPDKPQVSKEPESAKIKQETPAIPPKTPVAIKPPNKKANYVQVGAWSSKANARKMLAKVSKYYPSAYLDAGKKLNKVKIPVKNKAHGYKILKDVKDKLKLNPVLMLEE